jgi:hypothetical protein
VLLDVVNSWDEMMEPKGFAMPNPPRTSRSSCSRLNFLCSCSCTAETHLICPCSHLQGRRTWLQFRCVTLARTRCNSAAFPHQLRRHPNRPTTAAGRTLPLYTCGRASPIQPGPPPSLSHATLTSSAFVRTDARSHRHLHILREQSAVPLDFVCGFLLNDPRRSPRATLLLPGQVRLQPPHCNFSRISRDLPAHRCPARRAAALPLPAAEPVFARPCRVTPALAHAFQRCSRNMSSGRPALALQCAACRSLLHAPPRRAPPAPVRHRAHAIALRC